MISKINNYDISMLDNGKTYQAIKEYIDLLPIAESFKKVIGSSDFIKSNHEFYVDYPYLFIDAIIGSDSTIDSLCIAGFLYYQSIIYLDRILDKDLPIQQAFPISNICNEEAVKLLSSIFPLGSEYWQLWNKRKVEYLKAYTDDFSKISLTTFDDFSNHADNKSALGKLAIDALFVLGKFPSNDYYEKCLLLHKYYYTAFQILDDILDIREDVKKGQFNIAHYYASKSVEEGKAGKEILASGTEVAKYVHLSGISNDLYAKAEEYSSKAMSMAEELGLPYMYAESVRMNNTVVTHNLSVNGYIKTVHAECEEEKRKYNRNNVQKAFKDGIHYVTSKQTKSGYWEEICNNAGVSDVWATGFITSFLNEIKTFKEKESVTTKAIAFLQSHYDGNGWGYNRSWIPDNDSTNFALLSIGDYYNTACEEFDHVGHFDKVSGGVSTYYDKNALICSLSNKTIAKNVEGWLQPHPCVSAVSLYLLSKHHFVGEEINALISYIKSVLTNKSSLSYWWVDDIYTIHFLTKANLHLKDEELRALLSHKISEKVKEYQNGEMEKSPFNIGLLLITLSLCGETSAYHEFSYCLAQELLAMQNEDGSWDSSNAMCLPAVNNISSDGSREWNVSSYGVNIRALEFNRLYSSVVACTALAAYGNV